MYLLYYARVYKYTQVVLCTMYIVHTGIDTVLLYYVCRLDPWDGVLPAGVGSGTNACAPTTHAPSVQQSRRSALAVHPGRVTQQLLPCRLD